MSKYDIAIIGSGLGGLVSGAILSKKGYKVCVLERNKYTGGCLQSFQKDGVVFDTGIHYVGALDEGQVLNRIFRYLNLLPGLNIRKMDPNGFDRFIIGDKEYTYAAGYENFKNKLLTQFPSEEAAISTYISQIRKIAHSVPLYNLEPFSMDPANFFNKFNHGGVWEFICSITNNQELQQVLAGLNPLYAGSPENSFLYVHALILNHYLLGAWRFVDGSRQVAEGLVAQISKHGGDVFTGKKIVSLHGNREKILRAESEDGEHFEAENFISTIHPFHTMELLADDVIRKSYKNRLQSMQNTTSTFTLYLAFEEGKLPYMNHNLYYYPTGNVWGLSYYNPDSFPQNFGFYPTADTVDEKYTRSASVLSFMDFSEVEKWSDTAVSKRGQDYEDFKEEKSQRMLEELEKAMPGIGSSVRAYSSATPLTLRDYTATHRGATYGILRDVRNPNQSLLFPKTKIPNLYLSGQSLSLHGMLGTTMGALLTSAEFCNLNELIREINNA